MPDLAQEMQTKSKKRKKRTLAEANDGNPATTQSEKESTITDKHEEENEASPENDPTPQLPKRKAKKRKKSKLNETKNDEITSSKKEDKKARKNDENAVQDTLQKTEDEDDISPEGSKHAQVVKKKKKKRKTEGTGTTKDAEDVEDTAHKTKKRKKSSSRETCENTAVVTAEPTTTKELQNKSQNNQEPSGIKLSLKDSENARKRRKREDKPKADIDSVGEHDSSKADIDEKEQEESGESPSKDEKEATKELKNTQHNESAEKEIDEKNDPRLYRTLYVGNVAQDAKRKEIKKLFQKYGKVETVRIRGIIPVNPRVPKRAALHTKQLASFSDSFHAYVVYEDSENVSDILQSACEGLNMTVFMDRHIRVMPATNKTNGSFKHSLFLGNLPFDCSEEDLIRTFQEMAAKLGVEVVNARVNRDGDTGVGRGIGFVTFNDILGVQGCLNAAGEIKIGGRVIRMEPASKSKKLNTKTHKKNRRMNGKPHNSQRSWQRGRPANR